MKSLIAFAIISISGLLTSEHSKLAEVYINNYKDVAIQEMHRTGIPASIKLAQGLLESDWGRSDLAKTANNHFGIKCGGRWEGGTFYKEDDDKDSKGNMIESCFRAFSSPMESYMAHSDFLTDPRKEYRYGFLFEYDSDDYKAWARGLKKSGYATDPKYPAKLIKIIENYDLHRFDQSTKDKTIASVGVSEQTEASQPPMRFTLTNEMPPRAPRESAEKPKTATKISRVKESNNVATTTGTVSKLTAMPAKYVSRLTYSIESLNKTRHVVAKGGETVEQLARAIGVSVDDVLVFNELYDNKEQLIAPGSNVYIEKKKRSYRGDQEFHIVKEGETMQEIAQLYGMRLSSLYAKNRMPKKSETVTGAKLFLQRSAGLSERPKFVLEDSRRTHDFLFED